MPGALAALPVAIIGAGPVGLAAAAELRARDASVVVLEAGARPGASVLGWGHVRLFSPWRYDIAPAAEALLRARGWTAPDPEAFPTGRELVERYLAPLAAALAPDVRLGHRVRAVSRRADAGPFVLRVETAAGEHELLARAVIDASGTYTSPNPLGADGTPAQGEAGAGARISYGNPDPLARDRARFAGKRVLVVGSGHSAFGVLLDLAALPGTQVTWAVRRPFAETRYGGGADDALPARGALGSRLRALVARSALSRVVLPIASLETGPDGIRVSDGRRSLGPFDEIVAATGFRPDLAPLRGLRLRLDAALEAPAALAPLIDPAVHSCGTVPPHGARELAHPEPDLYIVGMKSYGRAPTFLMRTGYEQVRSIACALTGDAAGAAAVELGLPETGVCSGGSDCCDGPDRAPASACCSGADALIPLATLSAPRP